LRLLPSYKPTSNAPKYFRDPSAVAFCLGFDVSQYWADSKLKAADAELAQAKEDVKISSANVDREIDLADRVEKARDRINAVLGLKTSDEDEDPKTARETLFGSESK
jgi:hypothetical protein